MPPERTQDSRETLVVRIEPGDWPVAITDGLGMPCSDCGVEPRFDYRVTDEFWREHVPESPARLSVVCLPCLDLRCSGEGLVDALVFVQWAGTGHTVVLTPSRRFVYGDLAGEGIASEPRSATAKGSAPYADAPSPAELVDALGLAVVQLRAFVHGYGSVDVAAALVERLEQTFACAVTPALNEERGQ